MDAIQCCLAFLLLFFNAWIHQSEALQCYCHRCPNSTCTTDGLCYFAITKSASGTKKDSWCINDSELIPRDRPFICAPSARDNTGVYPMCCNMDWCNKNPNLSILPVQETTDPSHWSIADYGKWEKKCICISWAVN